MLKRTTMVGTKGTQQSQHQDLPCDVQHLGYIVVVPQTVLGVFARVLTCLTCEITSSATSIAITASIR